jgi:hypothetical protein
MVRSDLTLTNVAEPMPLAELEGLHEEFFRDLQKHPLFLFFVLEKRFDA